MVDCIGRTESIFNNMGAERSPRKQKVEVVRKHIKKLHNNRVIISNDQIKQINWKQM